MTMTVRRTETHTADSESAADAWLRNLERRHPLERVELTEIGGGRLAVKAYLAETPGAEPTRERVKADLVVPIDGDDEAVEEALRGWLRKLGPDAQDVDWSEDLPGLVTATATVPARHRGRGKRKPPTTPVPPITGPAPRMHMCSSCGTELPARGGRGRPRRYCGDACRSRAARERNPTPIRCELRAGGWPCDEPAAWVIREPSEDHPSGWSPHGLKVAACDLCADLVEQFAVRQPGVMFVERQPIADYRTELRNRNRLLNWDNR